MSNWGPFVRLDDEGRIIDLGDEWRDITQPLPTLDDTAGWAEHMRSLGREVTIKYENGRYVLRARPRGN